MLLKLLYPILTLIILPLIALAWILGKLIRPFKGSSSNGMILMDVEGEKVLFSPYFEFESFYEDTKLLVKVVVTLSNEGIMKKTMAPLTIAGAKHPRRALFREATLFFINQGESPIEVTPKFLEIDAETISKLNDTPELIAAGHYVECDPVMARDARDIRSYHVKAIFEIDKKMVEVAGTANRLSVKAMNEKYAKETTGE